MARESSPHPHASVFGVNSAGAKATLQLLADYGGDLARLARLEDHNSALGVLFLADRTAAAAWQTESTVCDKLQWVLPSKEEMEQVCVCVSVCLPVCVCVCVCDSRHVCLRALSRSLSLSRSASDWTEKNKIFSRKCREKGNFS